MVLKFRARKAEITETMQQLSSKAITTRQQLFDKGQTELASIIVDIQRLEEELLVVR